jgi:uncharacterized protein (DUF2062 family)
LRKQNLKLKKYFKNKLLLPILDLLRQGMSPEKLSLTVTLGIIIGIMPFLVIGSYILLALAVILRLNIPVIQIVCHAVIVVKVALFVPFLKMGQAIFSVPQLPYDTNEIFSHLKTEFWDTFSVAWQVSLSGILAWLIISIPLGYVIYRTSVLFFSRKQNKLILKTIRC